MDRLAAIEAFVRVVDAGSFSGAAKHLRVGRPAVSKTIAQLEERLDVRLLLRSTHGPTPTEAGRNLCERAKRSIEEAEEAELAARGAAAALTADCGTSAPVTFARLQIVPRLAAFFAENPALEVDLVLEDRTVDSIAAGIDVAFWMGPFGDSALIARKIAMCRRVVTGAPAYFDVMGVPRNGVSVGGSEWMFTLELKSGAVKVVLEDWSLPPAELWAVFPTGRQASAKARAFTMFMERQLSEEAE